MTRRRRADEASADLRASRETGSDDFQLVSAVGAPVVHPDRLDARGRLRAMAPSACTLVNLLCGFTSIRAAEAGRFGLAAALIAVAIVFDVLDGAVARAVGAITPFGLQFDSLADLVSFGIAPAMLLWMWSLDRFGVLGWALACVWLACAAFRLGRFNVTVDPLADKRYFLGLPSPGAAGIVLATVAASGDGPSTWGWPASVALALVPALLMASSFRFPSFRWLASPRPGRAWVTVLAAVVLVAGLAVVPGPTVVVVAYGYALLCPLGWATAPLRRRWFGDASVAPARHRVPSVFAPVSATDP